MKLKFKNLLQFTQHFNIEEKCSEYLAQMRCRDKPQCSHCKHDDDKIYKFKNAIHYKNG